VACRSAAIGARIKEPATHVEDDLAPFSDGGSTPPTSILFISHCITMSNTIIGLGATTSSIITVSQLFTIGYEVVVLGCAHIVYLPLR